MTSRKNESQATCAPLFVLLWFLFSKDIFLLTAAPEKSGGLATTKLIWELPSTALISHYIKMRVSCLAQGFSFALQYSAGNYRESYLCFSNHKSHCPQLFLNPQRSLVCPHMTCWVRSPWLSPYLSWLIQYSLFDRPLLVLHSARCQKQRRLSLLCVPPPFLHRIPAFHLSYHHSQKSHRGLLHLEAKGIAGWEWEEMENRIEGRGGDSSQSVDSACSWKFTLETLSGKLSNPPLLCLRNAFAHQSMTRLSFLELLLIISAS